MMLCDVLEPLVNVRDKEEIATTLVNIMQKLNKARDFLTEVVLAEVLRLGKLKNMTLCILTCYTKGSHMFFHALTFAGSRGCCLNTRPTGRVFKHLPRHPASVNAKKQTCVIVILAYFYLVPTQFGLKTLLKH